MIITCDNCNQKNRVPASRLDQAPTCGSCGELLAVTGTPHNVKPEQLDDLIANSPFPVFVDFWAPWCMPCRAAAPEVAKLAAQLDDVVVVKLNTQNHPEVAMREGVQGIPMFALYRGGERVDTQAGYMPAAQLRAAFGL